jgi:sulfide:quinone oxidoreductase
MTTQTMGCDAIFTIEPQAIAAVLETPERHKPRVVVLGGGVAGLTAAYELHRRLGDHVQITVVSASERFVLGLGLPWMPFGRKTATLSFPLAHALEKHGITFVRAYVEHVSTERRIVLAHYTEIPYDYLLITTGPRADHQAIPGVAGLLKATEAIWTEQSAVEAGHALERFLEQPGPVVIGAAQGVTYLSAAYEFALQLDYALRRRGLRARAPLTFVTPEPYLGHLDVGAPAARRVLERLFARRHITALTGAAIERVDREGVHLRDGQTLPAAYTMIMPPFSGVVSIGQSPDLTDAQGFVPVDARYRHEHYPEIYAAGVAASSPVTAGTPKTGYLAAATARVAAQNIAAVIGRSAPAARALPRLRDLRIIDGGDTGVLLLSADLARPLHLALPLPGRTAHWLKRLLTRYLLWKLHTGRSHWP